MKMLNSFSSYEMLRIVFATFLVLTCHRICVQGQSNQVSSKLDFDEAEGKGNSSVPIVPGGQQGGGGRRGGGSNADGSSNRRSDDDTDSDEDETTSKGKKGPKIHGVRVTVDTGDGKKTKESKESVEITDLGKHKKRVGIHTDITFEITADGEDASNKTRSNHSDEKEDASVPIFRGRGGDGSRHKSRRPYDPRTQWSPNFSSERRPAYDYYPSYPSHNTPVYKGHGDTGHSGNRPSAGDWNTYVPGYWTTERYYNEYYRPNSVKGYNQAPNARPCYCITAVTDNRRRRENNPSDRGPRGSRSWTALLHPTSSVIQVIDAKLEQPFSKK